MDILEIIKGWDKEEVGYEKAEAKSSNSMLAQYALRFGAFERDRMLNDEGAEASHRMPMLWQGSVCCYEYLLPAALHSGLIKRGNLERLYWAARRMSSQREAYKYWEETLGFQHRDRKAYPLKRARDNRPKNPPVPGKGDFVLFKGPGAIHVAMATGRRTISSVVHRQWAFDFDNGAIYGYNDLATKVGKKDPRFWELAAEAEVWSFWPRQPLEKRQDRDSGELPSPGAGLGKGCVEKTTIEDLAMHMGAHNPAVEIEILLVPAPWKWDSKRAWLREGRHLIDSERRDYYSWVH